MPFKVKPLEKLSYFCSYHAMKRIKNPQSLAIFFLILGLYSKSFAQSHDFGGVKFTFPLSCTLGQDCWSVNYVDVDSAVGMAKDFNCKSKTYDDHKGTDFALGSVAQMKAGVNVLAAVAGKVLRVRDSETDILKTADEIKTIKENTRECGNGILVDHGNGLNTIYCHLKQGSVVVKPGQKVRAGDKIAQVGQSGLAEFPHLHFGVLWEENVIDPYTGFGVRDGCGKMKERLWIENLLIDYEPVAIFDGGFREKSPDFQAIERGEENPKTIGLNAASFVFWTGFYNVEEGDEVTLKVTDPTGTVFVERRQVQEKTRARQYYFTGRKIGNVQLVKGSYKGKAVIKRKGDIMRERFFDAAVE